MTAHRIIKNLTRQGNVLLGAGCYSAAIAASNGQDAIKIGTNMDDPWLDFKSLVIDVHVTNPHIPLIKNFYIDTQSEYYVCVMERLQVVDYSSTASQLVDRIEAYVKGWHSEEEFLDILSKNIKHAPNPKQLLEILHTIRNHTTHFKSGRPVAANTSFYEECYDEFGCDTDGRKLDLHRGNFMLRDEVLVIIDPWCNVCMDDVPDLSSWVDNNLDGSR